MKKIMSPSRWCSGKTFHVFQVIAISLLLSLTANHRAAAADGVEFFVVAKLDHYLQTDESAPQLAHNPFEMELSVEGMDDPANLAGVAVTLPGGSVLDLEKTHHDNRYWELEYEFSDRTVRDQQFPGGDYTFTITTNRPKRLMRKKLFRSSGIYRPELGKMTLS